MKSKKDHFLLIFIELDGRVRHDARSHMDIKCKLCPLEINSLLVSTRQL